jgi:hypothetical protein
MLAGIVEIVEVLPVVGIRRTRSREAELKMSVIEPLLVGGCTCLINGD